MSKTKWEQMSRLGSLGRKGPRAREQFLDAIVHQDEREEKERRNQERTKERRNGTLKPEGPRGKFREYIENPDLTVEEAIDKFVKEQSAFLRQMLEGWLKEDSELGRIPESAVKKVEQYLAKKEQGREDDDDAR